MEAIHSTSKEKLYQEFGLESKKKGAGLENYAPFSKFSKTYHWAIHIA